jgi:hypothetical protein
MLLLDPLRGAASHLIRDRISALSTKLAERRDDDRSRSSSFQQVERQTFKQGRSTGHMVDLRSRKIRAHRDWPGPDNEI